MATVIEINLDTKDFISITKYSPKLANNKSIIISSATGVLQNYYSKFAAHFCDLGYTVYTFDYNGIGKSLKTNLKENLSNLSHWAKNQSDVINYVKAQHSNYKIILITHSIGGQLIGLNRKSVILDAVITVASQTGYWKYFKGLNRIKMFTFWYVLIPAITPFFGYFPSKKLGLFESLPKQVVYQWKNWGKSPDYFLSEFNSNKLFFEKITCPVLVLSFNKDEFAPKETVDWFAKLFKNSKMDRRHIVNNPPIGHFGFFRVGFKKLLWELTENWISIHT